MFKEVERKDMWVLDRKKDLPDLVGKTVVSPLHYGDTLEVAICRGISGETFINGKRFEIEPNNVFLIPPRYPHTSVYKSGGNREGDMICAFHINIDALEPILHIKKMLQNDNRTLFSFPVRIDDFESVFETVKLIMNDNRPFCARLSDLVYLFEIFCRQTENGDSSIAYNRCAIEIVEWVEEHYAGKLSVEYAADHFGFSKHYFCKWFKQNTGVTFNRFLNAVRINHACKCLINGHSVDDTAELCGFSDPAYFIKVFKAFRGMTPKAYAMQK